MKRLFALTLTAGLALPLIAAEEGKKPDEEKQPPKKEAQETADKKPKKDEKKAKKPDIFKPSEELSEDYSVPFPTDI